MEVKLKQAPLFGRALDNVVPETPDHGARGEHSESARQLRMAEPQGAGPASPHRQ